MSSGEKDFLTRNPGKTLTQGHRWVRSYSDNVLINADLDGGTLFDWWTTHVAKVREERVKTVEDDGQVSRCSL